MGLDYPILSDPGKETAAAYGVLSFMGFPSRSTVYIGADGKILFIDRKVKTSSAGSDIAAKLAELGVPRKAGASK